MNAPVRGPVRRLTDFVSGVSACPDEASARAAVAREAALALGASAGALVATDGLLAAWGEPPAEPAVLLAAAARPFARLAAGPAHTVSVMLGDVRPAWLVLLRSRRFTPAERDRLVAMAAVAELVLASLRTMDAERRARADSEERAAQNAGLLSSLQERQALLERLARIQNGISRRRPLSEVLDQVVDGAAELLRSEVVTLRLVDPAAPEHLRLAAVRGLSPAVVERIRERASGEGAAGAATGSGRPVVVDDYPTSPLASPALVADGVLTAMACPVQVEGEVVGALVVATRRSRRYVEAERDALCAFAEHVSIALTDARTVEELRDAQHAKDLLLATVSHELKTPLTVIMGALRTLQRHADALSPSTREDMYAAAFRRGRDLERLIDMLLRGARTQLAGVAVATTLSRLVSTAVSGFEAVRPVRVGPVPALQLTVDEAAVLSALGVLLENAVAHSPDGTAVEVTVEHRDGVVRMAVHNSGSLDADPDTLFTPFRRGPGARSPGVGLGLYIADRQARGLHGGIEAACGEGTVRFTLWFPVAAAPAVSRARGNGQAVAAVAG